MNTHAEKTQENKNQSSANAVSQKHDSSESTSHFVDNRPEAVAQRKLQEMANNSSQAKKAAQLQDIADNYTTQQQQPLQKKENNTGLPDNLKSGIENLSGYSMDDVEVHRNSDKPAQLQAHAYAQGTNIHLGPGQEKHLPHEAWHVVQQKQGRVKPTIQLKDNVNVNDDTGLEKGADVIGAKAIQNKDTADKINIDQLSSKIIQRRAEDPYERGSESPQVHHIISHSKLIGGIGKLTQGDQDDVKRGYLPTDSKLSVRQLYQFTKELSFKNIDPNIEDKNRLLNKENEWFSDMPWTDQSLTSLNGNQIIINCPGLNFNHTTLTDWLTSYNNVKTGKNSTVGTDEHWKDLKNSYFEWSGGNLFYGAQKRVEPGGADLDEFDEDAKYFRDPEHVAKLKKLANELEQAGNNTGLIKAKLLEIGNTNKDKGAGSKNDPNKWFKPKNDIQKQAAFEVLDSGARANFFNLNNGYDVLPKQLLVDQIKKWSIKECKGLPSKDQVHVLYDYVYRNSMLQPVIKALSIERERKRPRGYKVTVGATHIERNIIYYQDSNVTLKNMITDINDLMRREFTAERMHDLGL